MYTIAPGHWSIRAEDSWRRSEKIVKHHEFITQEQAGFRQHRSTEDQVTYIVQKIEDGFQTKTATLTVWADMEKAYNKVWKDGLCLNSRKVV